MSNPYESPQFAGPVIAAEVPDREKAKRVARYQQWVILALLGQIVLYFLVAGLQGAGMVEIGRLFALLYFPLLVFSMAAIFLLAKELMHIVLAILCTALMIVPCISLGVLLIVNGRATRYLRERGIRVGFMGANPNLI